MLCGLSSYTTQVCLVLCKSFKQLKNFQSGVIFIKIESNVYIGSRKFHFINTADVAGDFFSSREYSVSDPLKRGKIYEYNKMGSVVWRRFYFWLR
jgi:hypothetical protein